MGHIASFSPDGKSLYLNDASNNILQIDLMLESGELLKWVREHRYIRDLTCTERALYRVVPLCSDATN